MGRRVSVPAADELFGRTSTGQADAAEQPEEIAPPGDHQPSGRVRHDEKVTVYVTADELFEIERARLALRSRHGLAVDRGRLVREAVAMALADLEDEGEDSRLVQRLNGR